MKFRIFHTPGYNDNLFMSLHKFLPDVDESLLLKIIKQFNYNTEIIIDNNNITLTYEKYTDGLFITSESFIRIVSLLEFYNKNSFIINICSDENFKLFKEYTNVNKYNVNYTYCSIDYMRCLLINDTFYIIGLLEFEIFFGDCKTIDFDVFIRLNKLNKIL